MNDSLHSNKNKSVWAVDKFIENCINFEIIQRIDAEITWCFFQPVLGQNKSKHLEVLKLRSLAAFDADMTRQNWASWARLRRPCCPSLSLHIQIVDHLNCTWLWIWEDGLVKLLGWGEVKSVSPPPQHFSATLSRASFIRKQPHLLSVHGYLVVKLVGTHRVRTHAVMLLLVKCHQADNIPMRSRGRLVTPPSECRWSAVVV